MPYSSDKISSKSHYYRRGAIAFAVGQVSSFVTRYQEWQSGSRSRRDAKPPALKAQAGCYPVLYKGQCYKLHGLDQVEIKVLALLNQSMKQFLKALWLCPQSGEIIAPFSNAGFHGHRLDLDNGSNCRTEETAYG